METTAMYIGYIVIGLTASVLIGVLLIVLYGTTFGIYRVIKYKRTIWFIKKHETKAMLILRKTSSDKSKEL